MGTLNLLWFEQGTYILYQGLTVRLFIQYWKHNIYEAMMFIFYWIHRIISFITTMCYDQQKLFKKLRLTWQSYGLDCLSIFSRKRLKRINYVVSPLYAKLFWQLMPLRQHVSGNYSQSTKNYISAHKLLQRSSKFSHSFQGLEGPRSFFIKHFVLAFCKQ